eukprot:9156367-Alexandrium_andersonii.AAC.2
MRATRLTAHEHIVRRSQRRGLWQNQPTWTAHRSCILKLLWCPTAHAEGRTGAAAPHRKQSENKQIQAKTKTIRKQSENKQGKSHVYRNWQTGMAPPAATPRARSPTTGCSQPPHPPPPGPFQVAKACSPGNETRIAAATPTGSNRMSDTLGVRTPGLEAIEQAKRGHSGGGGASAVAGEVAATLLGVRQKA